MLDVLIHGGWVADGTGNPAYPVDVAVEGERIADIGRFPHAVARRTIDATGKIVCPGFVDPNGHSDWTILTNPTGDSFIHQGITSEIVGNCGNSFAPVSDLSRDFIGARLRQHAYAGSVSWSYFADYLHTISAMGTSTNMAWIVGHNAMRYAAGVSGPACTEEQARTMEGYVREAMEAGAIGMSSGLEFEPGRSATTAELIRCAKVAGEYDGYYTSHIRNRDEFLQQAVDEFLTIVRESGTHGELLHLNVRYDTGAAEGAWQRAVDTLEAERRSGLDVLTDTTPFTFGTGMMAGILPPRIFADGAEQAVEYLRDPTARRQLRGECDRYWRFISRGAWERLRMEGSREYPELNGKNFREIADLRGKDEWDCYFDILAAAGRGMESIQIVGILFTEEHLAEMIRHPLFSLSADTWSSRVDGPLSEVTRFPLPYCGHVHYLTHHVREKGTLRLEECIRKLTSMPATHFGLRGRGLLQPGYFADIVVFDYEALDDVSTLENPVAYARGVEYVLVNGVFTLDGGRHTGARAGQMLRSVKAAGRRGI
jgi:N-acyl-D-amino-acid deacylase